MGPAIMDKTFAEWLAAKMEIRGVNQSQLAAYLGALVELHDAMRARADAGADNIQVELLALGLQTESG